MLLIVLNVTSLGVLWVFKKVNFEAVSTSLTFFKATMDIQAGYNFALQCHLLVIMGLIVFVLNHIYIGQVPRCNWCREKCGKERIEDAEIPEKLKQFTISRTKDLAKQARVIDDLDGSAVPQARRVFNANPKWDDPFEVKVIMCAPFAEKSKIVSFPDDDKDLTVYIARQLLAVKFHLKFDALSLTRGDNLLLDEHVIKKGDTIHLLVEGYSTAVQRETAPAWLCVIFVCFISLMMAMAGALTPTYAVSYYPDVRNAPRAASRPRSPTTSSTYRCRKPDTSTRGR